jgi:hypothetical protein
MKQQIQHTAHLQFKVNCRENHYPRTQIRAEAALREIAFVLKMTQKVRQEIDQQQEMAEPILA